MTPLLWLLLSSFETQSEFVNDPAWSLPGEWGLHNYADAWTTGHVALYIRNSLLATVPSLALIIVLGTAGFALEVMIWRGRHQVLLVFLLSIMVPSQMILLPLFRVYLQAGLSGTTWPLIITCTAVGLPLTVSKTIIELEKSFNERWSAGDNRGYLDAFADEVSYFDPILKNIVGGRDQVIHWIDSIYSDPHIVRSEYLNPQVPVSDGGDLAVLAYNLNTYVLDENGKEKQLRPWNATHGYRLIDNQWRIVHSNWAFSETVTKKIAS